MRFLIITATYHPAINPNVSRWSAIVAQWVAQGHEVHVLCTRRHGSADEENLDGVRIHRSGQNSLLDWAYNLLGLQRRRGEVGGDHPARRGRLRRALERMIDFSWRSLYWPDGRCLWYLPGKRKALALHAKQPFDKVISVGLPFTAHLIAGALKRRFPEIRWVMDIEDPFCFSEEYFVNNFRLYRRLNYRAEGRLLRLADAATVTVEQARQRYLAIFPWLGDKIVVAPPVYSLPPVKPAPQKRVNTGSQLHLAYFGAFYHRIRTPDAVLAIFNRLLALHPEWQRGLRLHFYGEIAPAFLPAFQRYANLLPIIQCHGLVERTVVAQAMSDVDALINISNTTTYHLPSKCVDYLASSLPVVSICSDENDPFNTFMGDSPLLLPLLWRSDKDTDQLAEQLHLFLKQEHPPAHAAAQRRLDIYQPEVLAKTYFDLGTSVSGEK